MCLVEEWDYWSRKEICSRWEIQYVIFWDAMLNIISRNPQTKLFYCLLYKGTKAIQTWDHNYCLVILNILRNCIYVGIIYQNLNEP